MSIVLTETLGRRTMEVRSASLPHGAGGIALRFTLLGNRPMAFRLTDAQARWLIDQIEHRLATADVGGGC